MRIVILNGPNLNLLGKREPHIYGTQSMEQVLADIQRTFPAVYFEFYPSNYEADLIDWVQQYGLLSLNDEPCDGIILNAGGYTHTSIALRDAVSCCIIPVVELHISDIAMREEFRRVSLLSDVCTHAIIGEGVDGYKLAVEWFLNRNKNK